MSCAGVQNHKFGFDGACRARHRGHAACDSRGKVEDARGGGGCRSEEAEGKDMKMLGIRYFLLSRQEH